MAAGDALDTHEIVSNCDGCKFSQDGDDQSPATTRVSRPKGGSRDDEDPEQGIEVASVSGLSLPEETVMTQVRRCSI